MLFVRTSRLLQVVLITAKTNRQLAVEPEKNLTLVRTHAVSDRPLFEEFPWGLSVKQPPHGRSMCSIKSVPLGLRSVVKPGVGIGYEHSGYTAGSV